MTNLSPIRAAVPTACGISGNRLTLMCGRCFRFNGRLGATGMGAALPLGPLRVGDNNSSRGASRASGATLTRLPDMNGASGVNEGER